MRTQAAIWYRGAWREVWSGEAIPWRWRAPGDHVQIAGGPAGGVSVEWDRVHAACRAVDEARRGTMIGHLDGAGDVLGGSYYGPYFERRGLAGLVALVAAVKRCAHHAWDAIHDVANHGEQGSTRAAVRVAIAVHDLSTELSKTGVMEYDPANTICGVTADGRLHVQGLRWLVGTKTDDGNVPVAAARAYISGGRAALAEALANEKAYGEI